MSYGRRTGLGLAGTRGWTTPAWIRDDLYRRAGQMPAFDLRFDRGSIVDVIGGITPTFTRPSSVQTVWTGSGFTDFAADVPAFAVDPVTGRTGYVRNPAATNLFLDSAAPATQSIAVTAQAYTLSFYGTGTITLSGASTAGPLVGTGAAPNRVQLTFTPTAGTLTLTLSGTIVRPQLQTGIVADSPITTGGSAVTRAEDTMTVSGTTFSGWYNQAGGVLYVEGITALNAARWAGLNSGPSFSDAIAFGNVTGSNAELTVRRPTTTTAVSINAGPTNPVNTAVKYAARFFLNDYAISGSGAIATSANGPLPAAIDRLLIGALPNGFSIHTGVFYRLAYFPPGSAMHRIQQLTV